MYPTQLFEVVVHKVVCHDPHGLTYRTFSPQKQLRSAAGAKVETYLAISPDLLPLIEAPFAARIAQLEYELVGAVQRIADYRGKVEGYLDRIRYHNFLPWWRRWFHRV